MRQRIEREAAAEEAATLWTAADVLMGLRYSSELVAELLRGVKKMKESVTYQAIVEEGRVEEARQLLLDLGAERLGEPSQGIEQAIGSITDLGRLPRLARRLLHAGTWQELLLEVPEHE